MRKLLMLVPMMIVPFMGCQTSLRQNHGTVEIAPISDLHRLENLEGTVCVLPARVSTGYEQFWKLPSSSLASTLAEDPNITALSFLGLVNRINESENKQVYQRYSSMIHSHKENGMFQKSDLGFVGKELGIDYFFLPQLLELRRWKESRFNAGGFRILGTQKIRLVVGLEIWNAKGYIVFSALVDVTIAFERMEAKPISMQESFEVAWTAMMEKLKDGEGEDPKK